jgi:predicted nucleic acid-binding protein
LTLYLDSSALVKRYVREVGTDTVIEAMSRADAYKMCRIGFVETVRAVARVGERDDVEKMERDWTRVDVIEVDGELAEHAAKLAVHHRLRTLDALHLAAAMASAHEDPTFVTWDIDLHHAAREQGLRTLPAELD